MRSPDSKKLKGRCYETSCSGVDGPVGLFAMAASAEATVLRVVVVETDDVAAYMGKMSVLRADMQRLGIKSTVRVWRARFAGPNAGSHRRCGRIRRHGDLCGGRRQDLPATPNIRGTLKEMSKMRKIVSDSLYEELK